MNIERDKFLTEAMGERWYCQEQVCGYEVDRYDFPTAQKAIKSKNTTNDFSIWCDFGKLWEWAQKQSWWVDFWNAENDWKDLTYINPDKFADAVYEYLKE